MPAIDRFSGITSVGTRLVLSGNADRPGCYQISAGIDPASLKLGPVETTPCDQPNFAGQRAAADLAYDPISSTETFSVATHTGADGRVETGSVLATFEAPAGDHPITTEADGFLWVWGSPISGGGSQVTQVSSSTGAIVEVVSLPDSNFGTPLMAADDDGLWLALPPNTENTSPTPVYFLPSARRTALVTELPARASWWMAAEGHQVWIDTLSAAGSGEVLWTAKGSGGRPRDSEL